MSKFASIIETLEREVAQLQDAITALRGIDATIEPSKRPAKGTPEKATRYWSPESRKAAALRMKRYWAARRAEKEKGAKSKAKKS